MLHAIAPTKKNTIFFHYLSRDGFVKPLWPCSHLVLQCDRRLPLAGLLHNSYDNDFKQHTIPKHENVSSETHNHFTTLFITPTSKLAGMPNRSARFFCLSSSEARSTSTAAGFGSSGTHSFTVLTGSAAAVYGNLHSQRKSGDRYIFVITYRSTRSHIHCVAAARVSVRSGIHQQNVG